MLSTLWEEYWQRKLLPLFLKVRLVSSELLKHIFISDDNSHLFIKLIKVSSAILQQSIEQQNQNFQVYKIYTDDVVYYIIATADDLNFQ